METNFIESLKAEISAVETDIRENPDPRQRKLTRLRETLAEYEPSSRAYQAGIAALAARGISPSQSLISGAVARTKEEKIKAELSKIFKENGPQHRTVLLEHLKKIGLMGHEKDPMASFAAYLSGWKELFAYDGKGTWGFPEQFESAGNG